MPGRISQWMLMERSDLERSDLEMSKEPQRHHRCSGKKIALRAMDGQECPCAHEPVLALVAVFADFQDG